jgi:hypothetical protein
MKEKKMLQNEKIMKDKEKYEEKKEKLKELDIKNEKYKKKILKKIESNNKKRILVDRERGKNAQRMRNIRLNYLKGLNDNKLILSKEEGLRRNNILYFENYKFDKAYWKDSGEKEKRANSQYKTIANQKDEELKMKDFMKVLSSLKDESIIKKNERQKRAMYNEKLRKEREAKRKEEEKKLEKLGLI